MEEYIVPFYGFNDNSDDKELLGSAFLVRPNLLITAGHVVLDETGVKYHNNGFFFNNQFRQLQAPSYLNYKEDYCIDDKIYYDLAVYPLNMNIPEGFNLSEREIAWNEQYNCFGKGEAVKNNSKNRSHFKVTISYPKNPLKRFDRGRWIEMENCLEIKEILSPGDSGTPIYINEEVIGMIVYGIKDSFKKSPQGGMYGTIAIKASFIKEIVERLI